METSAFNTLVLFTFGLLVVVSTGVVYLTAAEWRDRRRRDRDRKEQPLKRGRARK